MNQKCLDMLKEIVDPDDYAEFEKLKESGDSKGWLSKVNDYVDELNAERTQLVRDVGIENELMGWHNNRLVNDPKLIKLQTKLAKKPSDRTVKSIEKRKVKIANDTLTALTDDSGWVHGAGITSLYKDELAQYQMLVGKLSKALQINPKVYGKVMRRMAPEDKRNIARAVYSGAQTDTLGASEMAAAINEAGNYSVRKLQSLGMPIKELEHYGLAQSYDQTKVYKMGKEAFVTYFMDEDKFFFRDNPNIKNPRYKPSENPEEFLGEMWENITRGRGPEVNLAQATSSRGKAMINRTEFRYIQPKDGDVWYDTAEALGKTSDPIEAAKDAMFHRGAQIAAIEKFGKNPPQMWDNIVKSLEKSVGGKKLSSTAKASFNNMVRPEGEAVGKLAVSMRMARDFESQSLLGSAPLSAVSDLAFNANEAWLHGLNPINVLTRHFVNMLPGNKQTELAQELAIIVPNIIQQAGQDHRLAEAGGNDAVRRMTNWMLTASGLNRWTDSSKAAFGLEFLKETAKVVKGGKINKRLADTFKQYGITAEDLAMMNDPKYMLTQKGVDFINPTALEEMDMEVGRVMKNFMAMTIELTHAGTPEPGIRMRSILTFGTKSGTTANEALKVITQFMSFPLSTALRTMSRMTDPALTAGSKISYGASLMTGATALGAMIVQAKSVLDGKGTQDMTTWNFWKRSFIQGGSMGLMADIMFQGKVLPRPPVIRRAEDFLEVFIRDYDEETFTMEADSLYRDLINMGVDTLSDASGFISNLWYTKLAYKRLVISHVERMTDPNYESKVERLNNKLYNSNPGSKAPFYKGGDLQWPAKY